jgi:hypothetical protein
MNEPVTLKDMGPTDYWRIARAVLDNPPKGWKFWDSEIPKWFAEYETARKGKAFGAGEKLETPEFVSEV